MACKAVILVGGPSRGTRFRPLSLNVPKPLFPVAGQPILYHHVAALSKVQNLTEILLIGFYEDSVFTSFIDRINFEFPHLKITYLREYQALGTAGGIYHFRDKILLGAPSNFFVLNADVCCSFPLSQMMALHQEKNAMCTILGTKVDKAAAGRFGCIVAEPETNEVLHYVEKPKSFVSDLISCGIYLFQRSIFTEIKQAVEKKDEDVIDAETDFVEESTERLQLEQDIFTRLTAQKKMFVYSSQSFFNQIKTAVSALPASSLYLQDMFQNAPEKLAHSRENGPEIVGAVYIHPSANVHPDARIGPNVSIGPRAVIGKGVRIRDSIILDNVEVQDHSCVLWSIIGWSSRIGSWARVEGTPMDNYNATVTQNGVKIQSITILGKEVNVDDEVIIRNCIVLPHKDLAIDCHNEILL
ncbi:hypothetical protein K7432_008220 [Basidiobolus ranarum]|uniref:mannose-1-phosphate guanylyltransferase n=1 Tax=Basidiobolus ranarum TaxID=34480 RepID=A0ABR2VYX1_9FUNG